MRYLPFALGLVLCLPAFGQDAQKLTPPDKTYDGNYLLSFGTSVDVQVNWVVVGAPGADSNTGAAYVSYYDGVGSPWSEATRLEVADLPAGARFGQEVAIDNRWIAVGAMYDSERAYQAGAVYMYYLDGGTWIESQKIMAPEGDAVGEFGVDVDIDGDLMVVSGRNYWSQGSRIGAAYVYRYDGATWVYEDTLLPSEEVESGFGESVAIDVDLIAIGAPNSDVQGDDSGSVYIFALETTPGNHWVEQAHLVPTGASDNDRFGFDVDIEGGVLLAGAYKSFGAADFSGDAYVFRLSGETWSEEATLKPADQQDNDSFGWTVALGHTRTAAGTVAVVGANTVQVGEHSGAGAVYLFEYDGTDWSFETKLVSEVPAWEERYGWAVAADDLNLVVGASANRDIAPLGGVAYVYTSGLLVVDVEDPAVAGDFRLDQNYPNPFNPTTTIRYELPAAGMVSLAVFDLLGREVRSLASGPQASGVYEVTLDAAGLPSGMYMYRLRTETHVESRSLVVLK